MSKKGFNITEVIFVLIIASVIAILFITTLRKNFNDKVPLYTYYLYNELNDVAKLIAKDTKTINLETLEASTFCNYLERKINTIGKVSCNNQNTNLIIQNIKETWQKDLTEIISDNGSQTWEATVTGSDEYSKLSNDSENINLDITQVLNALTSNFQNSANKSFTTANGIETLISAGTTSKTKVYQIVHNYNEHCPNPSENSGIKFYSPENMANMMVFKNFPYSFYSVDWAQYYTIWNYKEDACKYLLIKGESEGDPFYNSTTYDSSKKKTYLGIGRKALINEFKTTIKNNGLSYPSDCKNIPYFPKEFDLTKNSTCSTCKARLDNLMIQKLIRDTYGKASTISYYLALGSCIVSYEDNKPFSSGSTNFLSSTNMFSLANEQYLNKWSGYFEKQGKAANYEAPRSETIQDSAEVNPIKYTNHFITVGIDDSLEKKAEKAIFSFEYFNYEFIPIGYLANNINSPLKFNVYKHNAETNTKEKLNTYALTYCQAKEMTGGPVSKYCNCNNNGTTTFAPAQACDNAMGCSIIPIKPSLTKRKSVIKYTI